MNYIGTAQERNELQTRLEWARGEERLRALVGLAWYSWLSQTRQALALADEAQALLATTAANTSNERAGWEARLQLTRGGAHWLLGDYDAALSLTLAARTGFDAMGDLAGASDAYRVETLILTEAGQSQAAAEASRMNLVCSERCGDAVRAALSRAGTAFMAVVRDGAAEAPALFDELVDEARTLDDPSINAEVEAVRAALAYARNDFVAGILHYRHCLELRSAHQQTWYAVNAVSWIVVGFECLGDTAQALEWAEHGAELARSAGWPIALSSMLRRLAAAMRSVKRLDAARAMLLEALLPMGQPRLTFNTPNTFVALAEVEYELGNFETALRYSQDAEEAAARVGEWPLRGKMQWLRARAKALLGLKRIAQAHAVLLQALQAAERGPDHPQRIIALRELARMAREHGPELPQESTPANAELHYLQAALEIARSVQDYSVPSELWAELSGAHEAAGNLAQALACSRQALITLGSDSSKKGRDLASAVQVRYETERAHAETAHQKALAMAESARADAQEAANRAKGVFLANMSHELRSPLNAMLGFTRLLARDPSLPESARADLGIVERSGEHLYGLINHVLEVSKIEAGHVSVVPVDFWLRALIDETLEIVVPLARAKGLTVSLQLDEALPARLRADAQKLRQMLINLLSNAVKFTDGGGVRLAVHGEPPAGDEGDTARAGQHCILCIEVIDSGVGIAEDELGQLGEAFVQAGAGRAAAEGTGLGLAICRGFAQAMGGQLRLASRLGAGTNAQLRLPVGVAPAWSGSEPPARARVSRLAKGEPAWRVLSVDDRPDSRRLLVRLLQPLGFEVREAANGREALEQWHQWKPHFVCMDIRMPVMDGREATRRIKAEPGGTETVIVALTASSYEEEREEILACGCDDFLRKPFQEEALFELMERRLGVRFEYQAAHDPALKGEEQASEAALEALAALPRGLRESLCGALDRLDVNAIEHQIGAVTTCDAALGHTLTTMAVRFEYEALAKMLRDSAQSDRG